MVTRNEVIRTLERAGEVLTFNQAEILGIPGFAVESSFGLDGDYKVEAQSFAFQISTVDCSENSIMQDDEFTMEDEVYVYTFVVDKTPIPDLTGFSKLYANLIKRELV
mgnify:FL=1